MSSDNRDLEFVGEEIITEMKSTAFSDKLISITAEKNDGITLKNFRDIEYGWSDMKGEYPSLYIMGLREETIEDQQRYKKMWYKYAIEPYIIGDNSVKLEKQINRYARAINEILNIKYEEDGFMTAVDYAPTMKFQDALYKSASIQFWVKVIRNTTN